MNVNGIRTNESVRATVAVTVPTRAEEIKRVALRRDDVNLGLGPKNEREAQRRSEAEDARRRVEALRRELEELNDRSGFESFLAGLFGADPGTGDRGRDTLRAYEGTNHFLRDPD